MLIAPTFVRNLSVSLVGIPAISQTLGFVKELISSAVIVSTLLAVRTFDVLLSVSSSVLASISRVLLALINLSALATTAPFVGKYISASLLLSVAANTVVTVGRFTTKFYNLVINRISTIKSRRTFR